MLDLIAAAVGALVLGQGQDQAITGLLKSIIAARDDQVALLQRIDQNVQDLLRGPFNAGVTFLEEASRRTSSPDDRARDLHAARERFVDALGQEIRDPARRSVIEIHLALTLLALNRWEDAEDHLERAHDFLVAGFPAIATPNVLAQLFQATTGKEAALWPLLEAARSLRMRLGALPTSVPVYLTTTYIGVEPEGHRILMLRRVEPGLLYGNEARHQSGRFWRDYAGFPVKAQLWSELFGHRTHTLIDVATGRLGPPGPPQLNVVIEGQRANWSAPDPTVVTVELVRRTARDIVTERRAAWPQAPR
jgi:hypothetical protein